MDKAIVKGKYSQLYCSQIMKWSPFEKKPSTHRHAQCKIMRYSTWSVKCSKLESTDFREKEEG